MFQITIWIHEFFDGLFIIVKLRTGSTGALLVCVIYNSNGQKILPLRVHPSFFSSDLCILKVQHQAWRFSCQWILTEHQPEMKDNHQDIKKA